MRHLRFSIARLMAVVVIAAVGLAALRNPTPAWAGAISMIAYGCLGVAIVGAVSRRGDARAWWLGFSVFGCGYMALVASHGGLRPFGPLPTSELLTLLRPYFGHVEPIGTPGAMAALYLYLQIGHALWALVAGLLGGTLARFFRSLTGELPEAPESEAPATDGPPDQRWVRPALIAWVGLELACSAVAIRYGPDAREWAGAMFFMTWVLLGLAGLVALFGRGRRRRSAAGAALLGVGYLLLAFARAPYQLVPTAQMITAVRSLYQPLPTTSFLNAVRRRVSAFARGDAAANARIAEALEQPVSMTFPDPTPLQDVLRYVTAATATPTYRGIPIYLDPVGLAEAEKTPTSSVTIDLMDVPLRTSLRLCLDQLGLAYEVRDGYLRVTSQDSLPSEPDDFQPIVNSQIRWIDRALIESASDLDDPFLTVGHCLLALLAAGIGAVAAPIVAGHGSRPAGEAHRT